MSGIMALVSLDGRPVPPDLARAQLAAIAHRGEWEPRLWEAPGVALGHVNLPRTPEAEREFLPASDTSERYWITWDGRLDNRDELAPKLGYDAIERAQKTDAQYVLDAYIKWNDECVHQLLGDWAIVIWDSQERKLFCAKDPIGWRQLYYAEHEGLLAVGSEPQQFFANNWLPKIPNEDYVLRFLADALQVSGATCYSGALELHGGSRIDCTFGTPAVTVYSARPKKKKIGARLPHDYVDAFESAFESATRAQLRSNRPVGISLSGGLDSSYVAAVAGRLGANAVGFVGFAPTSQFMDERPFARLVAERTSTPLLETDIDDCWTLSSEWLAPEVFDDVNHPMQSATMSKLAAVSQRSGIGVTFGGEGGDEWLSGDVVAAVASLSRGQVRTAWRLSGQGSPRRKLRWLIRKSLQEAIPYAAQDRIRGIVRKRPASSAIVPPPGTVSLSEFGRTSVLRPAEREEIIRTLYRHVTIPVISWRDRNVFSVHGLEHRNPFNDLRVVETLASTPEPMKRWDGRRKFLLREGLRREGLVEIAARNDKAHYTELFERGVAGAELERVHRATSSLDELGHLIDISTARREVISWIGTRHFWWQLPWRFICVGMWLQALHAPRVQAPARADVRCVPQTGRR
ncbi:MAG: asparagine synthetase B [Dehalococcoidia bacterium]